MIHPPESDSFDVLCDMTTDGGGWTVIQKRTDASLTFWNKKWEEYKTGFSNGMQRNQWLGLEKIHLLSTKNEAVILRIELQGDRCNIEQNVGCSGKPEGYWFGEWEFKVGDEASNYRLEVATATTGNLTSHDSNDSFSSLNNEQMFTTIDRDNDKRPGENCAIMNFFGGWWHNECSAAALNGKYQVSDKPIGLFGFKWGWYHYPPQYVINPIRSEMKIRKIIKA
uniref:Fibrinogen C-terminal domain-containing protein n=1 Tax=Plectus sambesii TaxID=2011161 RepID=A0A914WEC2_9BILA